MQNNVLDEISLRLAPIEIESTLGNQNLVNTISGMFLMAGSNMLYLTDEETDGRIYFKDHHLISVYWNEKVEEEAIIEILKLNYAGVKILKEQESEDTHFKMDIDDFIKIAAPANLSTVHDLQLSNFDPVYLKSLSFIKGFLSLKGSVITANENLIPDAVPIEYLRSLIGDGEGFKGIFCKVNQLQGKQTYYIMIHNEMTWIFQLRKNAERAKVHDLLTKAIEKVLNHA